MTQYAIPYWCKRYFGWTSLMLVPLCIMAMLSINAHPDYAFRSAHPIAVLFVFALLFTGYASVVLLGRVNRILQHMS